MTWVDVLTGDFNGDGFSDIAGRAKETGDWWLSLSNGSGGFTAARIKEFEEQCIPVDAYGVGSSLIRGSNDFTADIVITDGLPSAKVGRHYRDNPRLERVT